MSIARRLVTGAVALALGGIALVGCAEQIHPAASDPPVIDVEDEQPDDADSPREAGVPEECIEAFPYVFAPADIADVSQLPADWPEAPEGAVLCMTASGGSIETADFATEASFEEVAAYYEQALIGRGESERVSGADNGTGWDALGGSVDGVHYQVQERDTGYRIAFGGAEDDEG